MLANEHEFGIGNLLLIKTNSWFTDDLQSCV